MTCTHDLAERETDAADGACSICLRTQLQAAQEEIARLKGELRHARQYSTTDAVIDANRNTEAALAELSAEKLGRELAEKNAEWAATALDTECAAHAETKLELDVYREKAAKYGGWSDDFRLKLDVEKAAHAETKAKLQTARADAFEEARRAAVEVVCGLEQCGDAMCDGIRVSEAIRTLAGLPECGGSRCWKSDDGKTIHSSKSYSTCRALSPSNTTEAGPTRREKALARLRALPVFPDSVLAISPELATRTEAAAEMRTLLDEIRADIVEVDAPELSRAGQNEPPTPENARAGNIAPPTTEEKDET